MPNVHVVHGQWKVELEGGVGGTSTFNSQEVAICSRTTLAKRQQGELIVHGREVAIRMRNAYGNDPRDVKG